MSYLDWSQCPAVESIPGKRSGAWVFKDTRMPVSTVFENLEGFPEDWQSNATAFVKFVRDHQCPSFLEYGEYPYVSADEVRKALKLKAAFSNMLDQMQ